MCCEDGEACLDIRGPRCEGENLSGFHWQSVDDVMLVRCVDCLDLFRRRGLWNGWRVEELHL